MTQIQKWPKLKNDPNSKMTQIQKWPKFKSDPNSKMTQIISFCIFVFPYLVFLYFCVFAVSPYCGL